MDRNLRTIVATLALAASGCYVSTTVAPTAASPDAQWQVAQWQAQYDATASQSTPEAALQRSRLAFEAVAYDPDVLRRLGRDPDSVTKEGLLALWRALATHPEWQDAWQLLGDWRSDLGERFDAAGASQAVCPAADRVRTFPALRLCGDLLAQAGRTADAIARWRTLVPAAQDAGQRNSLIVRIEHASLRPTVDLAGLTSTDIQVANEWEREREQKRLAAHQAQSAVNACAAACESQEATCSNAQRWWGPDCGTALVHCLASCQTVAP